MQYLSNFKTDERKRRRATHHALSREFARYEARLQEWAGRCTVNALWYLS